MQKNFSILLATFSLLFGELHAQLKTRSEVLLEKLAQFEAEEQLKIKDTIEKKRKEVIKSLKSYRDRALTSKNLDEANKIQKKIDELEANKSTKSEVDPVLGLWKWHETENHVLFYPDGVMYVFTGGKCNKRSWERKPNGTYVFNWDSSTKSEGTLDGDVLTSITGSVKGKQSKRIK